MKKRIYYNHTDAGGIVYHSNYITFCEQARSEIFFSHGIYFSQTSGYVIKDLKAKFIKSAKLGDIIEIKTKVKKIRKTSIELLQEIYKDDELIFQLEVTAVYIQDGKISKIPKKHLEILNEYV
ncbi:acyl-CoA thioesterase [Caminibacter pacificus]|uniref:Acyl-CoA thioester hydrolase n=1 Tax=Caminibacter pacificus TaxID=1424653 RepID=A0AAJ4RCL3_9BACT|nr:thioesterase family protein [Caminibacter pacificus]NPA88193.1 YbgC/FadM family acyl-CoA thioesterase [Campylobacterota bacterium]QCI27704.1 YbgC/FadM family acyl-CoA thioesterase [Caminibacter pacificus]ROR40120.1 acyl-CoA thioester hydrolase [Caminibacter pacificus]